MIGHNVTEVIAAAGAMMHQKASVEDVARTVFAHPTIAESLKESSEDALYMALHMAPRKVIRAVAGVGE
jgi:dihydrolipoamide dehydrogenase